ncbi:hypothetical protein [Flammeovirga sp. SJP92]|uniref:hypothetical protein n=1 Tax=Flammeovirga sp. SJP92 TaxID=1775430 RepID=UPI000788B2BE|nr:hypothetical protein [Flammeovirga sp. SJP92]KXX67644.1 hypothetical protein AVL50_26665 [Flammeovirga sp. SJP92]
MANSVQKNAIKWNEVISLICLNIGILISWIAYQEYQPHLLHKFNLESLGGVLTYAKAIIVVFVPILSGLIADRLIAKKNNRFIVYMIGISFTSMIFMVVATIIGLGPSSSISSFLPVMIILWLITMNIFISPAASYIELFAPINKLPLVMGVMTLVMNIVSSLEPIIVALINFFGDTLTFIVGAILISSTGFIFKKVMTKDVLAQEENVSSPTSKNNYTVIITTAFLLGLCKALLSEFIPQTDILSTISGGHFAFLMLSISAVVAFLLCFIIDINKYKVYILLGASFLIFGSIGLSFFNDFTFLFIGGSVFIAVGYSILQVLGLPLTILFSRKKALTFNVGLFIGISEIGDGIFEILL